MTENSTALTPTQRMSSIVALNAVSTFSQIGQFGLGTTLLPIALEARGASPENIGVSSAAFWLGMLAGLLVAGQLTRWLGYRLTVIIGLVVSAVSFGLMPLIAWHRWSLPAAAIGFGLGLRWIANETWLYRLAPTEARGRIVGIHETLISIASIVAPLIIVALSHAGYPTTQPLAFWVAAGFLLLAILPLFMAQTLLAVDTAAVASTSVPRHSSHTVSGRSGGRIKQTIRNSGLFWMGLGGLIAGLGGWIEGGLLALLPVYMSDIGRSSQDTAWLLSILGMGAMACQFPLGWLADHKSVVWTAKLASLIALLAVVLILAFDHSFYVLAIGMFILGGLTGGLLTLGIIWATQHSMGAALTERVRQVSIVYTTLSAAGPLAAGFIVSHGSSASLFWQQLVVIMVLIAILFR